MIGPFHKASITIETTSHRPVPFIAVHTLTVCQRPFTTSTIADHALTDGSWPVSSLFVNAGKGLVDAVKETLITIRRKDSWPDRRSAMRDRLRYPAGALLRQPWNANAREP